MKTSASLTTLSTQRRVALLVRAALMASLACTPDAQPGGVEPGDAQPQSLQSQSLGSPAGSAPSAASMLRLVDESARMRFALPERSVPREVARRISDSGFRIRGEELDLPCSESIVFPALRLSWWNCRTTYPMDVAGATDFRAMIAEPEEAPEVTAFRVVREGRGAPLLRGSMKRAHELDRWIPTRRGFSLPVPDSQPGGPRAREYRVDYPVDPGFLRALDPAHAQVDREFVVREVEIGGDLRRSLYAPAPAELVFPVSLPAAARLNLGVGVLEEGWFLSDGISFEVSLRFEDGSSQSVFSQTLDPGRRSQQRRWVDVQLDLSAYAGRRAELVFATGPGAAGDNRFDFAAFGEPVLYGDAVPGTPVILVDLDTLRADRLQVYGYERETSPALAAFARDAVVFEQAIAQAPWTLPSQVSILTGQYPATHGVRGLDQRLDEHTETLAGALARAGYLTKAFTDAGSMSHEFGFHRGFDSYSQTERHRHDYLPDLMRRFRRWFDVWTPHNFFLLLHTYEPHEPYAPPRAEIARFDAGYVGTVFERFSEQGGKTSFQANERERRHLLARYDGEIRYTDRAFGEILELLRLRGLYDRALIVVLSDHGEEFGEHGGWLHGHSFYDELLRVPLLIKFPRSSIPPTRVSAQVELIDVMPTILDFLDLPIAARLDGRSLLPLLLPESEGGLSPEAWAAGDEYAISDRLAADAVSLRTASHKLVQMRGERSFYDLVEDPGELRDRFDPEDPVVRAFVAALDVYLARERDEERSSRSHPLDPDVQNQLRALGYLE